MARRFDSSLDDPATLAALGLTREDIALIRSGGATGGGGGTNNTGDATAADVALGKTFSSALLTNVAGTSTKNVTVSEDLIQPPQAFVDNIALIAYDAMIHVPENGSQYMRLKNKGLTGIYGGASDNCIFRLFDAIHGNDGILDLSDNDFPQSVVDGVLSRCATSFPHIALFIDGGTTAIPTSGAANVDGWLVGTHPQQKSSINFNVRGGASAIGNGYADFNGATLDASEVNALLAFLTNNYLTLAWILNLAVGNAAPTGQGLIDKQTLIDAGWTVTTN